MVLFMLHYGLSIVYHMNFGDERKGRARGKFRVLELRDELSPESLVKFFFRISKIYSIAEVLTNQGVFGMTIISFQDYSAVALGFNEWKLVNVDFFKGPGTEEEDPVIRIFFEVYSKIREDKIPTIGIELVDPEESARSLDPRLKGIDPYRIERRWIRWVSEACERYLGEKLSDDDVDRLIEWYKKWWGELVRRYTEADVAWAYFGKIGQVESFDEF